MMDERQRVIRDLLVRLHEAGISPDEPFSVDFLPGEAPRFRSGSESPSFSLAEAGVARGAKILPR